MVFGKKTAKPLFFGSNFYGPAGAGKSAIARKIAELCHSEQCLLASFFFSRTDSTRGNATFLIATIAYQIATNFPMTRGRMAAAMERDPLLLTRSLESQVTVLVVEPLQELINLRYLNSTFPRCLIIIDGLDECGTANVQCKVLDTISLLFQKHCLPLVILIASRPERHLTHSFSTGSLSELHTTLALDDIYQPDDDIWLFLADNFTQVKDTHPMRHFLDPSWPPIDVVESLVEKSSGQFIYASTVMKYVLSVRYHPADRLNVVLGIRPPRHVHEMPFGELDALYRHIFSFVEDIKTLLLILGFQIAKYPNWAMKIADMERFLVLDRGYIEMLLGDLSSIIIISDASPYIHILHASLPDFLLDATRSKEFYINLSDLHTTYMLLCFHHNKNSMFLYSPSKYTAGCLHFIDPPDQHTGIHVWYASHALIWHCENIPPSANTQHHEKITKLSLCDPYSCFPGAYRGQCLLDLVPQFLWFIKVFFVVYSLLA